MMRLRPGGCLAFFVGALLSLPAAYAQVPADIAAKLREIGATIDPPRTGAIYAPLQRQEPYDDVNVARDVKYGPAARNLLDIFRPTRAAEASRPVLAFVHGGGFVRGNKQGSGPFAPFYDNVMLWAVKNGMVGVNLTYRLAPDSPWPSGAQDIDAAMQWVHDNIARFGGDPKRIVLVGHSAGAVHVASYIAHPELRLRRDLPVAGAVLLSGLYDLTSMQAGEAEKAYFGEDASKYAERSSIEGLKAATIPLLVVTAELDPPQFQMQAAELEKAVCNVGHCPTFIRLQEHSHMSETFTINTADESLSGPMLDFVRSLH